MSSKRLIKNVLYLTTCLKDLHRLIVLLSFASAYEYYYLLLFFIKTSEFVRGTFEIFCEDMVEVTDFMKTTS